MNFDKNIPIIFKKDKFSRILNSSMLCALLLPIPWLINWGIMEFFVLFYLTALPIAGPLIIMGFFRAFRIVVVTKHGMQVRGLLFDSSIINWEDINSISEQRGWVKIISNQGKKFSFESLTENHEVLKEMTVLIKEKRICPEDIYDHFHIVFKKYYRNNMTRMTLLKSLELPESNAAIIPDLATYTILSLVAGVAVALLHFTGFYFYVGTPGLVGIIIVICGKKLSIKRNMISPSMIRFIFVPLIVVCFCFGTTLLTFFLYDYLFLNESHQLSISAHKSFSTYIKSLIDTGFMVEYFDTYKPAGKSSDIHRASGLEFISLYIIDAFILYISSFFSGTKTHHIEVVPKNRTVC